MPNTIDGQYILYVLLIFSFLSDIFCEKIDDKKWKRGNSSFTFYLAYSSVVIYCDNVYLHVLE